MELNKTTDGTPYIGIDTDKDNIADMVPVIIYGSKVEVASAQVSLAAGSVTTYNRATGATVIEIYVESGNVRIRTDGSAATATTGEPLGEGFNKIWIAASISIYAVDAAIITEVSR